MRILIVTALFPPDIAHPAPYLKELATRLSQNHTVTVLTYGAIPEGAGSARVIAVPKRTVAPLRLLAFGLKLWQLIRTSDAVFVHNAPSTEVPLLVVGPWFKRKLTLVISDHKVVYTGWRRILHSCAQLSVHHTITLVALPPRPIMHPFKPLEDGAVEAYEAAWRAHLNELTLAPTV